MLRLLLALVDAGGALFLIGLISTARFGPDWRDYWGNVFREPWAPALMVTSTWVLVLWSQGLYRLRSRWTFAAQAGSIGRALAVMTVVTFAALFVFKFPEVSRLFLVVLLPAMAITSLLMRGVIHLYLRSLRVEGKNNRFVLVVGSGPAAVRYTDELRGQPALGLQVIGYLNGSKQSEPSMGVSYLGTYESLGDVLHSHVVDEVAVCLELAEWELINNVVDFARAEGKTVRLPIAGDFLTGYHGYVENLSGMPVLSLIAAPDRDFSLAIKRAFDLVGASLALLLCSPILIGAAIYIRAKDGSPVLFTQTRLGVNGRPFTIYKFRTMVKDAEARYAEVAHLSDTKGAAFKMTDDPRITSWGQLLRKTSIDELPQLLNVIKGEMSLVGPRPAPPREIDGYDVWHRRRLTMKPGITGMWQISSRFDENFDDRARLDLEYIDRWSLWLDVVIAARTVPALLRSEGR
jgi:exopolysaccharide biosynthesis polyprenyl glycosylphosphotransferase